MEADEILWQPQNKTNIEGRGLVTIKTASVETRQAVHMAQSQQLSVEDLHIQSATMSGTEKSALSAESNSMSSGW